jgi:endonuclease/exonuclease/phosphatase family metal-dependent hydrolase
MNEQKFIGRRAILKSLGIVTAAGLIPKSLIANPGINDNNSVTTHKIVCANIRVDLPDDETAGVGWSVRKNIVSKILHVQRADILCLQEVLKSQNDDMKKMFPQFISFGFDGPEMDPIPSGYHGIAKNPIMFLKSRYDLISAGTYWLSESPLIGGSKSWDTARARHANWVRLMDKKGGTHFRVVNTHLDHLSQNAREKQIALIIEETEQYQASFPQILTGDFNEDSTNPVISMIRNSGWTDSYVQVHGEGEPGFTGHAYKGKAHTSKKGKIDFIFSRGPVKSTAAKIIRDEIGGRYPSDHFFVTSEFIIQ